MAVARAALVMRAATAEVTVMLELMEDLEVMVAMVQTEVAEVAMAVLEHKSRSQLPSMHLPNLNTQRIPDWIQIPGMGSPCGCRNCCR